MVYPNINCPYCGKIHSLGEYVFLEDNELEGKFHIQCKKCNEYISICFNKNDNFTVKSSMSKQYIELIEGIEDLDGVSSYVIFSDSPIPKELISMLTERNYIGISSFIYYCNLYSVAFEEFRED